MTTFTAKGRTVLAISFTLEQLQTNPHQCPQVKVDPAIQQYLINLVRATRNDSEIGLGGRRWWRFPPASQFTVTAIRSLSPPNGLPVWWEYLGG